jgi:hypothetical protein
MGDNMTEVKEINELLTPQAIKKYLRDDEDRATLNRLDLSIEECLSGKYNKEQESEILKIFHKWNQKLGCTYFFGLTIKGTNP